jgi:mono/diheme cytochrome c family protein
LRSWFAIWFASGGPASRKVQDAKCRWQTLKGILSASFLILLMPSTYAASLLGDSANGKRLYDANCMGCHDTSVLTRKNRVVQSLDALEEQLASCTHMAKKEFSENETQDLLKYLNDQFYHFH